jgi:hypothetical protein
MARDFIEKETNTALVSNTYTEYRNGFPSKDNGVITLQINGDLTINNQAPQVAYLKDGVWTNLHDGTELIENGEFEEQTEKVTNGDFATDSDWTKAGGATTSGGVGYIPNTGSLAQSIGMLAGKTYSYTIVAKGDSVTGDLRGASGGIQVFELENLPSDYQTYTGTFIGVGATLLLSEGNAGDITIQSISVKELDPNDYWTLGTGWTIDVDKVEQSGSTSYLSYDSFTPTIGTKYEVVYTVSEYTSGFTSIDFAGSSLVFTESSLGTFSYEITATTTDKFQIKSTDFVGAINSISIIPFTVDYFSSEFNGLPRVEPNGGWDVTPDDRLNSVKIIYTAGPPEAGVIAPPLKQAMYLLLAHYYDNRSAVSFGNPKELPLGYKRIINNYKNPIWS